MFRRNSGESHGPGSRVGSGGSPGKGDRDRPHSEAGATLLFVAVMSAVLFGFAALVVDMGRVYVERNTLQNGADAAALAIAADCAAASCGVFYDADAVADMYGDANAGDGASAVVDVDIDLAMREVTVTLGTEEPDGGNVVDMLFASVLGIQGIEARATATVQWGAPSLLTSFPLVMSGCEWAAYGSDGFAESSSSGFLHRADAVRNGSLAALSAYDHRTKSVTIYFHGAGSCHDSSSGQDLPGGFGWLDAGSNGCSIAARVGTDVTADPGSSPSNGCDVDEIAAMVGTVQLLPIFDGYTGSGNTAAYHVSGFAPLYVTGYNFGGQYKEPSLIDGQLPCTGNGRCVQGYLLGDWAVVDGAGAPLLAEGFGVTTTRLSG